MPVIRVTDRTPVYTAIQWTGDNTEEIASALPSYTQYQVVDIWGDKFLYCKHQYEGGVADFRIPQGFWLVSGDRKSIGVPGSPGSDTKIVSNYEFNSNFGSADHIDIDPPVVNVSYEHLGDRQYYFEISASDVGGGTIERIEYRLGHEDTWTEYSAPFTATLPEDVYNMSISAMATDSSGNVGRGGVSIPPPTDPEDPTEPEPTDPPEPPV